MGSSSRWKALQDGSIRFSLLITSALKLPGMRSKRSRPTQPWAQFLRLEGVLLLAVTLLLPASAQDIQGMEVCTAEKQMERRTGCLQANVEFLQGALSKLALETQKKIAAADRDLTAARAEIAALKSAVETLNSELTQMKAKTDNGKK